MRTKIVVLLVMGLVLAAVAFGQEADKDADRDRARKIAQGVLAHGDFADEKEYLLKVVAALKAEKPAGRPADGPPRRCQNSGSTSVSSGSPAVIDTPILTRLTSNSNVSMTSSTFIRCLLSGRCERGGFCVRPALYVFQVRHGDVGSCGFSILFIENPQLSSPPRLSRIRKEVREMDGARKLNEQANVGMEDRM